VITADIPAERAVPAPRRGPARTPKPAVAWGTGVIMAAVVLVTAVLTGNDQLIYLAVVTVCGAAFVTVGQLLYSRQQRRLGSPPPPRRGPALDGRRLGSRDAAHGQGVAGHRCAG
jgi:peptidoglycan/LPS O-acetylase OafA/YrhL